MRRILFLILLLALLVLPVSADSADIPEAPPDAQPYMPDHTETFAEGLLFVLRSAIQGVLPETRQAMAASLSVIVVAVLTGVLASFTDQNDKVTGLAGIFAVSLILMEPSNVMIQLGRQTIAQITEYGKLLLPVMAGAMVSEGGITTATALYAGTAFLNSVLCSLIMNVGVSLVFVFLVLSIAKNLTQQPIIMKTQKFVKWLITWSLKIILYVFTGYMAITGVVSGATDAAALKATKLTISGMVPVVGNILSDASEAILVSARLMKNAAGIYGLIAFVAILAAPFFKIAIQYLLLKLSAALCASFSLKSISGITEDFSSAMGFTLAMTGSVCLFQLISTICFMKGFT